MNLDNQPMIDSDEMRVAFSRRLKSALDNAGVRAHGRAVDIQKRLADRGIKVSTTAIGKWLNGEATPDRPKMVALADWLGVTANELEYGEAPTPNVGKMPRPGEVWNNEDELDEAEYAFAPRMAIGIPCGDGKPVFEIDEKGQRQAFRRTWLERIGANPAKIATITADGNSMAPRILDQDSLVIDYSQKAIRDGKVFVIIYSDEWYIKRVFKRPDGGLRIVSDNPDKVRHPDWEIGPDNLDQVQVAAKVVALSGAVD